MNVVLRAVAVVTFLTVLANIETILKYKEVDSLWEKKT